MTQTLPLEATQQAAVTPRPPLPPFTRETALAKVQAAEDAWNTLDPAKVARADQSPRKVSI